MLRELPNSVTIVFIALLFRRFRRGFYLSTKTLLTFNILEYTFIQCTFASFFTNGRTLCYVSDGQNGIEFVFTGWIALPILALLSFLFDKLIERKIDESVAGGQTGTPIGSPPNPLLLVKRSRTFAFLSGYIVIVVALTIYYGNHWWDVLHYKGDETIYYAVFLLLTSILFQGLVWLTTDQIDWRLAILGTIVNFILSPFIGAIVLMSSGLSGISRELIFIYGTCFLTIFAISTIWQVYRLKE